MITLTPSNEELFIRRRRIRLFYYLLKGNQKSDIISKVAHDFDCSERTVARDIGKMNEWIISILPLADSEREAFEQVVLEFRILTKVLYKINNDRENSPVVVNALKNVLHIWESRFKLKENTEFFKEYLRHNKAMRESKIREEMKQSFVASIKRYKDKNKTA